MILETTDGKEVNITVAVIDKISTGRLESPRPETLLRKFDLEDGDVGYYSGEIDILIGMDYCNLMPEKKKTIDNWVLMQSKFGLLVCGSQKETSEGGYTVYATSVQKMMAKGFLSAEDMGVSAPPMCKNCKNCQSCSVRTAQLSYTEAKELQSIEKLLQYDQKRKRWVAEYPKIKNVDELPNNRKQVEKITSKMEARLKRNGQWQAYQDAFMEAVKRGVYRELTEAEIADYQGPVWYICLVDSYKEGSTTSIRLCSNASMKYQGSSLNDLLVKGPAAMNPLYNVLMRWRGKTVACVRDISKFYNAVESVERDRHLRRVLFREDTGRKWREFLTCVINFGDRCAGCTVITALFQTAEMMKNKFPTAAKEIRESSYVDDILSGQDTLKEAKALAADMDKVVEHGGFKFKDVVFSGDRVPPKKVLGMTWNPESDVIAPVIKFNFTKKIKGIRKGSEVNLEDIKNCIPKEVTRRMVWAGAMAIFDPIGLISPLSLVIKMVMAKVTENTENSKIDWDAPVPEEIRDEFVEAITKVAQARCLTFPRSVKPEKTRGQPMVVGFSDGSLRGICCIVYLRWVTEDGIIIKLVSAKTKVNKSTNIPRTELSACLMLSRLVHTVMDALQLKDSEVVMITDSSAVLGMLKTEAGALGQWCGSRVREIQSKQDLSSWKWTTTDQNIADIGTRGDISAEDLGERSIYQQGPSWLKNKMDSWPIKDSFKGSVPAEELIPAARKTLLTEQLPEIIRIDRYNSFKKLVRIWYTVYVAIFKFKKGLKAKRDLTFEFNIREIESEVLARYQGDKTKLLLIRAMVPMKKVIKTPLAQTLNLIVASSRTPDVVVMAWDRESLPLVDYQSKLAAMIMYDGHQKAHGGVSRTLDDSRRIAWVFRGRRLAAKVVNACQKCKILDLKSSGNQLMAPVHSSRIIEERPFVNVAVDLWGPIIIKDAVKKRVSGKAWGLIIICTLTGAVSLEITEDLSASSMVKALRIHSARFGAAKRILSDRGTQMTCLANEIKNWKWDDGPPEWVTVPVRAQWRNGSAERHIGILKKLLKRLFVKTDNFTYGDWRFTLGEIQRITNDRPLPGSTSPQNVGLRPSDLLLGCTGIRDSELTSINTFDKRTKVMAASVDRWWQRWRMEVLPTYIERRKWGKKIVEPRKGDVVALLGSDEVTTQRCKLGRIVELLPGEDGIIRTVIVETSTSGGKKKQSRQATANLAPIVEEI